jgi:hypothetical protein
MGNVKQIASAKILNRLPGRSAAAVVPDDLLGATIVNVGTFRDRSLVEGGGLVIDYRPTGGETQRLVLAFDETAMWVEALVAEA